MSGAHFGTAGVHDMFAAATRAWSHTRAGAGDGGSGGGDGDDGEGGEDAGAAAAALDDMLATAGVDVADPFAAGVLAAGHEGGAVLAAAASAMSAGAARGDVLGLAARIAASVAANAPRDGAGDHSNVAADATRALRFDLEGYLVRTSIGLPPLPRAADATYEAGLHHHGAEQEVAGYSLHELLGLARSGVANQRGIAYRTLAAVLRRRRAAMVSAPSPSRRDTQPAWAAPPAADAAALRHLRLPPLLPVIVRCAIDDDAPSLLASALALLRAFLVASHAPGDVTQWDDADHAGWDAAVVLDALAGGAPCPPAVLASCPHLAAAGVIAPAAALAPIVLPQPPAVPYLTSSTFRASGPAFTLPAGALAPPAGGGDGVRPPAAVASDGHDALLEPAAVMLHRMGLVPRLAAILTGAMSRVVSWAPPATPSAAVEQANALALVVPALEVAAALVAAIGPAGAAALAACRLPRDVLPPPGCPTLLPWLAARLLTPLPHSALQPPSDGSGGATPAWVVDRLVAARHLLVLVRTVARCSRSCALDLQDEDRGLGCILQPGAPAVTPSHLTLASLARFLPLSPTMHGWLRDGSRSGGAVGRRCVAVALEAVAVQRAAVAAGAGLGTTLMLWPQLAACSAAARAGANDGAGVAGLLMYGALGGLLADAVALCVSELGGGNGVRARAGFRAGVRDAPAARVVEARAMRAGEERDDGGFDATERLLRELEGRAGTGATTAATEAAGGSGDDDAAADAADDTFVAATAVSSAAAAWLAAASAHDERVTPQRGGGGGDEAAAGGQHGAATYLTAAGGSLAPAVGPRFDPGGGGSGGRALGPPPHPPPPAPNADAASAAAASLAAAFLPTSAATTGLLAPPLTASAVRWAGTTAALAAVCGPASDAAAWLAPFAARLAAGVARVARVGGSGGNDGTLATVAASVALAGGGGGEGSGEDGDDDGDTAAGVAALAARHVTTGWEVPGVPEPCSPAGWALRALVVEGAPLPVAALVSTAAHLVAALRACTPPADESADAPPAGSAAAADCGCHLCAAHRVAVATLPLLQPGQEALARLLVDDVVLDVEVLRHVASRAGIPVPPGAAAGVRWALSVRGAVGPMLASGCRAGERHAGMVAGSATRTAIAAPGLLGAMAALVVRDAAARGAEARGAGVSDPATLAATVPQRWRPGGDADDSDAFAARWPLPCRPLTGLPVALEALPTLPLMDALGQAGALDSLSVAAARSLQPGGGSVAVPAAAATEVEDDSGVPPAAVLPATAGIAVDVVAALLQPPSPPADGTAVQRWSGLWACARALFWRLHAGVAGDDGEAGGQAAARSVLRAAADVGDAAAALGAQASGASLCAILASHPGVGRDVLRALAGGVAEVCSSGAEGLQGAVAAAIVLAAPPAPARPAPEGGSEDAAARVRVALWEGLAHGGVGELAGMPLALGAGAPPVVRACFAHREADVRVLGALEGYVAGLRTPATDGWVAATASAGGGDGGAPRLTLYDIAVGALARATWGAAPSPEAAPPLGFEARARLARLTALPHGAALVEHMAAWQRAGVFA